ncbi:phosphatase PAP2 family protein [Rubrivirga sp. IMCC43871]|uniref:phosphatase PAP2 family protein n=1 Tax=Rubrivirga sp. IMCC43871 TaxID=3391575 RepID=UPI0039902463
MPESVPSAVVHEASGVARFLRARLSWGARYGLGLTLAVVATFGALAAFVELQDTYSDAGGIADVDRATMELARSIVSDDLTPLVVGLTDSGSTVAFVVLVVTVAILLLVFRRRWEALQLVLASGLGGFVVLGLKTVFARPRPAEQVIQATGFSFPSGHAFASTVFYGTVLTIVWQITDKPLWRALAAVLCPLMILAIGLSRVYLNVHYVTDVLAGFASGFVWLTAVYLVVDGVEHRRKRAGQAETNRAQHTVDESE